MGRISRLKSTGFADHRVNSCLAPEQPNETVAVIPSIKILSTNVTGKPRTRVVGVPTGGSDVEKLTIEIQEELGAKEMLVGICCRVNRESMPAIHARNKS
jgi:hypothetical protein